VDDLRREVVSRVDHHGQSLRAEQILISALCRLPADVREQALEHCYFLSVSRDVGGFYLPVNSLAAKQWLVVLNEDWSEEDLESAVAHEVAHLWLQHPPNDLSTDVERHENEAAALVREWGFSGMGALGWTDRPE
jgi:hypothetical protein